MMHSLQKLEGKRVEIIYQGLVYTGILTGVGSSEVYVQTLSRRVELPMSGISAVRALPKTGH